MNSITFRGQGQLPLLLVVDQGWDSLMELPNLLNRVRRSIRLGCQRTNKLYSWILNSMERDLAEIFSYSESSFDLWNAVRDMYGNQNNSARIFQIHREIASLHQDGKPFVSLLVSLEDFVERVEDL